MTGLSKVVSGHASPTWEKLGKLLLGFACAALIVTGVLLAIPTGGASLLAAVEGALAIGAVATTGIYLLKSSREKGLAKEVSFFKAGFDPITKEEGGQAREAEPMGKDDEDPTAKTGPSGT